MLQNFTNFVTNRTNTEMSENQSDDTRSLREQVEEYIFDAIAEFEDVTGETVTGVDVFHKRPIGFDRKPYIEVNLITK